MMLLQPPGAFLLSLLCLVHLSLQSPHHPHSPVRKSLHKREENFTRGDTTTTSSYDYSADDEEEYPEYRKVIPVEARDMKAGGADPDNSHSNYADTYDPDYYDWGFGTWIAPGVPPPDAKNERPTTTDISCWDCDEQEGESCLLVRCDYTLVYNSSIASKGFACIRYQVVSGSKIYNKAKCAHTPSAAYDPCEEETKQNQLPAHMQNCLICWDDGCNTIQKQTSTGVLLAFLGLGLLFCLFALCIGARNKYFCEACKIPAEQTL